LLLHQELCVVGLVANVVPYHHARWNAFGARGKHACHLIETTDKDEFQVLEFSGSIPPAYHRVTLFPGSDRRMVSRRAINRAVAKAMDILRPSIVCLNGYWTPESWLALRWCQKHAVPAVVCSESNEFDKERQACREFLKSRIVRLCSAALAGGSPQAEYLVKLGLGLDQVLLGYDVVDNSHFARGAEQVRSRRSDAREQYGLPRRFFLAAARFTEKKNFSRLIRAYARYRERGRFSSTPDSLASDLWDLVLLGDGPVRPNLSSLVSDLSLHEYVHLLGAKPYDELPAYYGLADAFIHASTTEQWGLVVNEAMASGLPVLVSKRCGCTADLVQEGKNGFTFDPFSDREMADRMLAISHMTELELRQFAETSRRIIGHWGPDRFAVGLQAAVDKALQVGPRKPDVAGRLLLRALLAR